MKKKNLLLLVCLLLTGCNNENKLATSVFTDKYDNITTANWQSVLQDDIPITQINLPGTHDSATSNLHGGHFGQAKCQNKTIKEQLYIGARFFDLRFELTDDRLILCHGQFRCYKPNTIPSLLNKKGLMTFDDTYNYFKDYLVDNPTEFVIVSLKEEYCRNNITHDMVINKLNDSIASKINEGYLYTIERNNKQDVLRQGDNVPTIKDVRGKIIYIFKNTSGDIVHGKTCVADRYGKGHEAKLDEISRLDFGVEDKLLPLSKDSKVFTPYQWVDEDEYNILNDVQPRITYTSSYKMINQSPKNAARTINKWLENYNMQEGIYYGWILYNYAKPGLFNNLIETNTFIK